MKIIELDAGTWKTQADFYDNLLDALGAPEWHGENLDALRDSIIGGAINAVSPPFEIRISSTKHLPNQLRAYLRRFDRMIAEARAEGITVLVEFRPPL